MGRNFADLIPLDDLPVVVNTRENLVGASLTSEFQTTTIFPSVSFVNLDVYAEYVPRPVPRAPRTIGKRGRAAGPSSSLPGTKKPRQTSTHPGTQVLGSMLLGEHINTLCLLFVCLLL